MSKSKLIGTWKFMSMMLKAHTGKTVHPYGKHLFGKLIYTPDGYMSALLMDPDRKKFASDDLKSGTADEIKQAYEKFDAYCGTYTVDEDEGTVTHHVEGAKFPNWVGTDQLRYFELKEGKLYIRATLKVKGEDWQGLATLVRM